MTGPEAGFMRRAIRSAQRGIRSLDGGPFGACIVRGARVAAVAHNTVLKRNDPTCHAEMNAIRTAARKRGSFDLSGHVIYSTTEPCPMCFAAIHWARIDKVVYGTGIPDVKARGFHELMIPAPVMKRTGRSRVRLVKGFLLSECRSLLDEWDRMPQKIVY